MNRFFLYFFVFSKLFSQELSESLITVMDKPLINDDSRYHLTPLLLDIAKGNLQDCSLVAKLTSSVLFLRYFGETLLLLF